MQDLVQDLASLARKILARFAYFLQGGFLLGVYTCIVLFRYDNIVFDDKARLHSDRLRGTDEIRDEETI